MDTPMLGFCVGAGALSTWVFMLMWSTLYHLRGPLSPRVGPCLETISSGVGEQSDENFQCLKELPWKVCADSLLV